jgi:hypothetical protein
VTLPPLLKISLAVLNFSWVNSKNLDEEDKVSLNKLTSSELSNDFLWKPVEAAILLSIPSCPLVVHEIIPLPLLFISNPS